MQTDLSRFSLQKSLLPFALALFFTYKSQAVTCEKIDSYKQALQCASENHPQVQMATVERARSSHLEEKASQRPSLEFSGKHLNNLNESSQSNSEVDLSFTFELGGKRSARIEKARREAQLGEIGFEATKSMVLLQVLLEFQKLKNLNDELGLLDDGISTFGKILKIYRGRMKLSPEQDVSSGVFSLALEDYKIRRSVLSAEIESLLKSLELRVGSKIELTESLLPPSMSSWPDVSPTSISSYKPSHIRLLNTDISVAEAEIRIARSEAWPDLKIGPVYEWSQGPSANDKSLGLALTLPLPIWNRNQGGIAVAEAEFHKTQLMLNLAQKEIEVERAAWLIKYNSGVRSIKEGLSLDEVRKRRKRLRNQFSQGLVPSSLVIEANRQILEFTKSKNELELSTLEAFWNLKKLSGSLDEVTQ